MNQKATEKFLRTLAGAIEDILTESTGERMGFALLIFPVNKPVDENSRVNYISNCPRSEMIGALRSTLIRWETGNIDPIDEKSNTTNN